MKTRNQIWAILAVGFLAVAATATAMAKPDGAGQAGQDHRQAAQDRREAQREKMQDLKDKVKAKCEGAADNSTLEKRCELAKDGIKARRAGAALLEAIHAHERILG